MAATKSLNLNQKLQLSHGYRMQWEEAQNCYVLLFPEGLIRLNETAADILLATKGQTLKEGLAAVERHYETSDLKKDFLEFISEAHTSGWITLNEN